MTSQVPERILVDGKPHWLYAAPLEHFLRKRRITIADPDSVTTACHRRYIGTWSLADGRLWLVTLSTYGGEERPLSAAMRARFLRRASADGFPIPAEWFSGCLRIPTGPMLVRGFGGWSSWFTRERVITCREGQVVRDREVDTLAMLERTLHRSEGLRRQLDPEGTPGGPMAWITDEDHDHLRGDWWPPDWPDGRPPAALRS